MNTSSATVECALQNDRRLIAAVGAIVAHAAQHAGLSERDQEEAAAATADACRKVFAHLPKPCRNSALRLVVDDFSDHIAVTIEYPGEPIPPSASHGSEAPNGGRGAARRAGNSPRRLGFDSASQGTNDGWSRLTLVKYGKAALNSKPR